MARLIDANALHVKIMKDYNNDFSRTENIAKFILRIETAPTIDAEPVRHGHWINDTFCSECNRFPVDVSFNVSNQKLARYFSWCPHCGAKMDGGVENG